MKDILLLYSKKTYEKKRYMFTILFAILFIYIMFIILFNYNQLFFNEVRNNIQNRKLNTYTSNIDKNIKKELLTNSHIETIFLNYSDIILNDKENNEVNINTFESIKYDNAMYVSMDLEDNEIIVSEKLKEKLGEINEIELFGSKKYKFQIKDVHDNDEEKIFINEDMFILISEKENIDLDRNSYIIITDSYDNNQIVIDYLSVFEINAGIFDYSGIEKIESYSKLMNILKILIGIVLIIVIISLNIIIKNTIQNEGKDLSYMMICGYKKRDVFIIMLLRNMISAIIVYVISVFIIVIIYVLLKNIIYLSLFKILIISFLPLSIVLFIIVVSSLLTKKYIYKSDLCTIIKSE